MFVFAFALQKINKSGGFDESNKRWPDAIFWLEEVKNLPGIFSWLDDQVTGYCQLARWSSRQKWPAV